MDLTGPQFSVRYGPTAGPTDWHALASSELGLYSRVDHRRDKRTVLDSEHGCVLTVQMMVALLLYAYATGPSVPPTLGALAAYHAGRSVRAFRLGTAARNDG